MSTIQNEIIRHEVGVILHEAKLRRQNQEFEKKIEKKNDEINELKRKIRKLERVAKESNDHQKTCREMLCGSCSVKFNAMDFYHDRTKKKNEDDTSSSSSSSSSSTD